MNTAISNENNIDTVVPFNELEKVRTHVSLPRKNWVMSGETVLHLAMIYDHFKKLGAELLGLGPHPNYDNDYIVRVKEDGWLRDYHISIFKGRASGALSLVSVAHKDARKAWTATPEIYSIPIEEMIDKLPFDSKGNAAPAVIRGDGRLALDMMADNISDYLRMVVVDGEPTRIVHSDTLLEWCDTVNGYFRFTGDCLYVEFFEHEE